MPEAFVTWILLLKSHVFLSLPPSEAIHAGQDDQ